MWQFWQRGCWSTARIGSNAAPPSAPEPAELGVDSATRPINKTTAVHGTPKPNIEAWLILTADLLRSQTSQRDLFSWLISPSRLTPIDGAASAAAARASRSQRRQRLPLRAR